MEKDNCNNAYSESFKELQNLFQKKDKHFCLFTNILNSISEAFLLLSLEGEIVFSNKFSTSIFNKNITGNNVENIFDDDALGHKIISIIKNKSYDEIKGELFHFNNGVYSYCLFVTLYPHITYNSVGGWILMLQDYTEQMHKIQQQQRNDLLSSARQISSSIAHEIKNPLGGLSIHLQLLTKNIERLHHCNGDEEVCVTKKEGMYKHIRVMEEEIENISNSIGMFLTNFENKSPFFIKCKVTTIIHSLINFIKPLLIQNKIRYTIKTTKEELYIAAVPSLIRQVLLNLVKNAIEEMTSGGHITIKAYKKEGHIFISVADTGGGISIEKHEEIFAPYITSKEYGTGIGLAISDKIMQNHRGRIYVDSKYKKGARFILDFPVFANEHHLLPQSSIQNDIHCSHTAPQEG